MRDDVAATTRQLVPFVGLPDTEHFDEEWPAFEDNFYRCPNTGVWVYKYADERIIAAVVPDAD